MERTIAAACCAAATSQALAQVPCKYEVTHVIQADFCPFGNYVFPTGISESGRYVCGYREQCDPSFSQAFLFDTVTDQFLNLPHPPGIINSEALDVSDEYVVGFYSGVAGTFGFIFEIETGQYTNILPQNAGGIAGATGVNSNGLVCGSRTIDDGGNPSYPLTAFVYDIATQEFIDISIPLSEDSRATDINDNGAVTGWVRIKGVPQPFTWQAGSLELVDILTDASNAIDDQNRIVGSFAVIGKKGRYQYSLAFQWHDGTSTELNTLPGFTSSTAIDTNSQTIVGSSSLSSGDIRRGVVWQNGIVRDLHDLVQYKTLFEIYLANAIAENGTIAVSAGVLGIKGTVVFVLAPRFTTGDINGDCEVNVDDLLSVINDWGDKDSPADLNTSGVVDHGDLTIVIENWTL